MKNDNSKWNVKLNTFFEWYKIVLPWKCHFKSNYLVKTIGDIQPKQTSVIAKWPMGNGYE